MHPPDGTAVHIRDEKLLVFPDQDPRQPVGRVLVRDVVGLSYTEIAGTLEITLATVKWRIYKAREEVQIALHREGVVVPITSAPSVAKSR